MAATCGQITCQPAPRNTTACEMAVKWVKGERREIWRISSGRLSSGEAEPEIRLMAM